MSWTSTWRDPPPPNKTLSVRFGASVCFAYYHKLIDKWFLVANGTEEEIAVPGLWWRAEPAQKSLFHPLPGNNHMRHSKRALQLQLL
jgi:hypothetical protein